MKTLTYLACIAALSVAGLTGVRAQSFPVPGGSTGADGPLNVTENTALSLPRDGVFNFTTIRVAPGATLTFTPSSSVTYTSIYPAVHLLATSDVLIEGIIDVSGTGPTGLLGGKGGPGGFDGAAPAVPGLLGGRGFGPGGGGRGEAGTGNGSSQSAAGSGVYATLVNAIFTNCGLPYGSPLLMPPLGGSGGGSEDNAPNLGGGGGGGAIVVCSNTRIEVAGRIEANGGAASWAVVNSGSGGAIRLVAPKVAGTGELLAGPGSNIGSAGRIRIDAHDRTEFRCGLRGVVSQGSFVVARLPNEPHLRILHLAGRDIPVDGGPVEIVLPVDAPSTQPIRIRADNFGAVITIEVVVMPVNGPATTQSFTLDNAAANPAILEQNLELPGNTLLHVEAYKR